MPLEAESTLALRLALRWLTQAVWEETSPLLASMQALRDPRDRSPRDQTTSREFALPLARSLVP